MELSIFLYSEVRAVCEPAIRPPLALVKGNIGQLDGQAGYLVILAPGDVVYPGDADSVLLPMVCTYRPGHGANGGGTSRESIKCP